MSPLVQILAQANRPTAAPTPATIYPTNVASIYNNYDQAQMDAYKAKLAQSNAQFGGLASLGSAGISVLPKLLGSAGALGAGADISGSALAGLAALGPAAII
jgi:hypothetical protein